MNLLNFLSKPLEAAISNYNTADARMKNAILFLIVSMGFVILGLFFWVITLGFSNLDHKGNVNNNKIRNIEHMTQ